MQQTWNFSSKKSIFCSSRREWSIIFYILTFIDAVWLFDTRFFAVIQRNSIYFLCMYIVQCAYMWYCDNMLMTMHKTSRILGSLVPMWNGTTHTKYISTLLLYLSLSLCFASAPLFFIGSSAPLASKSRESRSLSHHGMRRGRYTDIQCTGKAGVYGLFNSRLCVCWLFYRYCCIGAIESSYKAHCRNRRWDGIIRWL